MSGLEWGEARQKYTAAEMVVASTIAALVGGTFAFLALHAHCEERRREMDDRTYRAEHVIAEALAVGSDQTHEGAVYVRNQSKSLSGSSIRRVAGSAPPLYYIERWPKDWNNKPFIHHSHSTSLACVIAKLHDPPGVDP